LKEKGKRMSWKGNGKKECMRMRKNQARRGELASEGAHVPIKKNLNAFIPVV
jgi:hypothetical protein